MAAAANIRRELPNRTEDDLDLTQCVVNSLQAYDRHCLEQFEEDERPPENEADDVDVFQDAMDEEPAHVETPPRQFNPHSTKPPAADSDGESSSDEGHTDVEDNLNVDPDVRQESPGGYPNRGSGKIDGCFLCPGTDHQMRNFHLRLKFQH